ncbi:hypothetical protein G6514_000754 [Epicoccum nigrum]|nr:hypothetical protein G6514_000754 [Epicoccum nigrum]
MATYHISIVIEIVENVNPSPGVTITHITTIIAHMIITGIPTDYNTITFIFTLRVNTLNDTTMAFQQQPLLTPASPGPDDRDGDDEDDDDDDEKENDEDRI